MFILRILVYSVLTLILSVTPVAAAPLFDMAPRDVLFTDRQAVTASAVALASHTAKTICLKAMTTNLITVYFGTVGVTTSTGFELTPGEGACLPMSNSNLIYVIASTTGASVTYYGTN